MMQVRVERQLLKLRTYKRITYCFVLFGRLSTSFPKFSEGALEKIKVIIRQVWNLATQTIRATYRKRSKHKSLE